METRHIPKQRCSIFQTSSDHMSELISPSAPFITAASAKVCERVRPLGFLKGNVKGERRLQNKTIIISLSLVT